MGAPLAALVKVLTCAAEQPAPLLQTWKNRVSEGTFAVCWICAAFTAPLKVVFHSVRLEWKPSSQLGL